MSRLLSLMLLYKSDYDVGRFISFERQVDRQRHGYYEALKGSSSNWDRGANDYIPFVDHFLETLLRCYNEWDSRIAMLKGPQMTKKERIRLTIWNSIVPIRRREIENAWPDIAVDTTKKAHVELHEEGSIRKSGR